MSRNGEDFQGKADNASTFSRNDYPGCPTPPHAYAASTNAPHFSHQDFSFKKTLCLTKHRRSPKESTGDADIGFRQAAPDESVEAGSKDVRIASCDKQREATLKWHAYNHKRQDEPNMKDILQPGDCDDGDSLWGVIREDRNRFNPHWSWKQFQLKKRHHSATIHKTPENSCNVDAQASHHLYYQDPKTVVRPESSFDHGTSHVHNSHAHLSLQKRRHNVRLEHDEVDFRSLHPPFPSPEPHFFASPEPKHMACHLYPEGPAATARHVPEHFVSNVVFDSSPCQRKGIQKASSVASGGSKAPDSARMVYVLDGTKKTPVAELFGDPQYVSKASSRAASPSATGANRTPWRREFVPPSDEYDWLNHPGKPPTAEGRRPEVGHVYKSHAQMAYDKNLCIAHGFRGVDDRWERIAAGSQGHSVGGSDFGSGFGSTSRGNKQSNSVEPTKRRSRSSDPFRRSGRQSSRSATPERSRGRAASEDRSRRRADSEERSRRRADSPSLRRYA